MMLYAAPLLAAGECAMLRDAYDRNIAKSEDNDYSGWPVLRLRHFVAEARDTVGKCVGEAIRAAQSFDTLALHEGDPRLYPETIILTAMGPGGCHVAHADNVERDAAGRWVPNHTPDRTHTAMVYLSEWWGRDFDGGELHFPAVSVSVRPREGLLVVFPSDGEHVHEVSEVTAGKRYALSIWLTDKADRAEPL
jgi:predicted 2-oxoglutarate/Fe(II)-dependent dioxygenase YbiX